jgi:hypothetical protein
MRDPKAKPKIGPFWAPNFELRIIKNECGFSAPHVPHALFLSMRCPLYPNKRTSTDAAGVSALCHKRTYATQQIAAFPPELRAQPIWIAIV